MFRALASICPQMRHVVKSSSVINTKKLLLPMNSHSFMVSTRLLGEYPVIQKPVADFSGIAVVNGDFKEIKLSDYKGKYVVIFFYPLDFTFVCPTELIAFSEKISEFEKLNTQVIGVSTDSHFSHLAWMNTPRKQGGLGGDLGYPLLSDFNKTVSKQFNVLLNDGYALRGLFIIDNEGILRHFSVNDLPVGRSVEETLRLIKAFQFVAKHGEVCPANWQPESKTIKPNPKDSKEYFGTVN
ncbi:peroxiredoxin-like [Prorops nasuta]|uniref:peroxiredoxin-like n=1 Tax=Prorops nasuta TaxID=863751 RepID=UPI0034CFDFD9